MALTTHGLPPLRARPAWVSREMGLQARRRTVDVAMEAGRFALVLGLFGVALLSTTLLRVVIWVPFFHH